MTTPITIAYGDGIGPEIMPVVLSILEAAGAKLTYETIEIGEKVYNRGISSGIEDSAWESLRRTKVFLKAPITTPQGGGFKSLNVTVRKALGLFANVRPCLAYAPYVPTRFPNMDLVIIRENEEDLYGGIEYRQSDEVFTSHKVITRPGCKKIIRYAFDYARSHGRKKVSCFSKDNIMKLTDGLFHKLFDEIGAEYPEIEKDHFIIDIGAARIADSPEMFDVVVTLNLYGDIISDIAAQVAGSVGLAGSSNVSAQGAMFEAIHGSAPMIAGQNIANPSGLLQGALMMLQHIGQGPVAARIHNAWLCALEDGVHTADIYREGVSQQKVGTKEFGEAVIARLGKTPKSLKPMAEKDVAVPTPFHTLEKVPALPRELVGIDLFFDWRDGNADALAAKIEQASAQHPSLALKLITNRGVKVWPNGLPETFCADIWRCRFKAKAGTVPTQSDLIALMQMVNNIGVPFVKTEQLYNFEGKAGYSLGQGE